MNDFFGIPLSPSAKEKTPIPLPKAVQQALLGTFCEWQDAGYTVHPSSTKGDKNPLSVPNGSSEVRADGTRPYGWGAIRDGDVGMLTYEEYGDLVKRGLTHGISVLLPRDSRFAMLEVERVGRPLLPRIMDAAKGLGVYDVLEAMVRGYTEESTRGGLHFPFRVSGGDPVRRDTLAKIVTAEGERKVAAEVIGAGFQFIAAPSCGRTHESGLPYTLIYGCPSSIVTITPEQQQLVYEAFSSINEAPRPAATLTPARTAPPVGDVVVDFNRRARWEGILVPKGWKKCGSTRADRSCWRRPGKVSGTSGTTCGQTM
jgi:hypothetical protein